MKKIALILSGCGVFDGSEIHESVLCLLALQEKEAEVQFFAPDIEQRVVKNHLTQKEESEKRNVLVESARIARGAIKPLSDLSPSDFDGILLPGGSGAALNLSTYGIEGEECSVNIELEQILHVFLKEGKPIGATCISPAILAKAFEGKVKLTLTLGSQDSNAQSLEKMGAIAEKVGQEEMVSDDENRVYTTPCYMEEAQLPKMLIGIRKVVEKITA